MIRLALIGGPTAVGKSTIVDMVLSLSSRFARPVSYTTRLRRPDEQRTEYEHVSFDEFEHLRLQGEFITVDNVYGNLYAISLRSVMELNSQGVIAIKEVHPKNHNKIKYIFPEAISIVILPTDLNDYWEAMISNERSLLPDRRERYLEDKDYYTNVSLASFDLRYYASPDIQALALDIIRDIVKNDMTERIERKNSQGYNSIATEFSDNLRLTTANFHDLTRQHFAREVSIATVNREKILDLGSGTGFTAQLLEGYHDNAILVDLSLNMLEQIQAEDPFVKICGSAFALPFKSSSFDVVIASLADPFFRDEALKEIHRVLKLRGRFLFSSPCKEWTMGIRKANNLPPHMTAFAHSDGELVEVYSFTYSEQEIRDMLSHWNFSVECYITSMGGDLKGHYRPISPVLLQAARLFDCDIDRLPIIDFVVAIKNG